MDKTTYMNVTHNQNHHQNNAIICGVHDEIRTRI